MIFFTALLPTEASPQIGQPTLEQALVKYYLTLGYRVVIDQSPLKRDWIPHDELKKAVDSKKLNGDAVRYLESLYSAGHITSKFNSGKFFQGNLNNSSHWKTFREQYPRADGFIRVAGIDAATRKSKVAVLYVMAVTYSKTAPYDLLEVELQGTSWRVTRCVHVGFGDPP